MEKLGGKTMKRLLRLIRDARNYKEFEETVLHFLKWYNVPLTWTKSDLHAFYFNHGGKI